MKEGRYYYAIAFISDIHGNLEALESVLEDIKKHDVKIIYCLGDLVGYGPNPKEVIRKIMELKKKKKIVGIVSGNHDYEIIKGDINKFQESAIITNNWTLEEIKNSEEKDFLEELANQSLIKEIGRFYLVHSSINPSPNKWAYLKLKDIPKNFIEKKILFIGHTHVPALYTKYCSAKNWAPISLFKKDGFYYIPKPLKKNIENKENYTYYKLKIPTTYPTMIINVGSVGQPRDGSSYARYLLYYTLDYNDYIEFRQVSYPIKKTVEKLKERGLKCDKELAIRLITGGDTRLSNDNKPAWFPFD